MMLLDTINTSFRLSSTTDQQVQEYLTQLRGKKIITENPKEKFTKVPNEILLARGLSAVDKLILIQLHYYPSDWILAYTRLASDLGVDKSNLIYRWKHLIAKSIIVETDSTYSVNYKQLGRNTLPNDGRNVLPEKEEYPTKVGRNILPSNGGNILPTMVGRTHLNGRENLPIEEDTKEKEVKNKTNGNTPKNLNYEVFSFSKNSAQDSSFKNSEVISSAFETSNSNTSIESELSPTEEKKEINSLGSAPTSPPVSAPAPANAELRDLIQSITTSYQIKAPFLSKEVKHYAETFINQALNARVKNKKEVLYFAKMALEFPYDSFLRYVTQRKIKVTDNMSQEYTNWNTYGRFDNEWN